MSLKAASAKQSRLGTAEYDEHMSGHRHFNFRSHRSSVVRLMEVFLCTYSTCRHTHTHTHTAAASDTKRSAAVQMLFVPVQYTQGTSSQAHYSALPFTHTGKQQHSFRKETLGQRCNKRYKVFQNKKLNWCTIITLSSQPSISQPSLTLSELCTVDASSLEEERTRSGGGRALSALWRQPLSQNSGDAQVKQWAQCVAPISQIHPRGDGVQRWLAGWLAGWQSDSIYLHSRGQVQHKAPCVLHCNKGALRQAGWRTGGYWKLRALKRGRTGGGSLLGSSFQASPAIYLQTASN